MLPPPARLAARLKRGRAHQPGPTFPQSPGIILEISVSNLLKTAFHLRSFNELRTSYHGSPIRQWIVVHRVVHFNRMNANAARRMKQRPIHYPATAQLKVIHRAPVSFSRAVNKSPREKTTILRRRHTYLRQCCLNRTARRRVAVGDAFRPAFSLKRGARCDTVFAPGPTEC